MSLLFLPSREVEITANIQARILFVDQSNEMETFALIAQGLSINRSTFYGESSKRVLIGQELTRESTLNSTI